MTPDYTRLVNPELLEAALFMRETTLAYTPMTRDKLQSRRAWMEENAGTPLPHVPYEVRGIPRTSGPDVLVYVVNPQPGRSRPGVLHMHGGGFTASTALLSLPQVQAMAAELDCTVVSVDYRLAPETTWEGSLDDNYTALLWLHANADALGVARDRIALVGESAGGGHAALVALAARDRGEVPVCFQCLTYPMLDDRTGTSRQLAEHIGWFGWSAEANRFGWASFLGCQPGGDAAPVAAVPARREDLAGLPPTWIGVGGLDLFVEEGIDFALRLNRAGVATELLVVPGAFHGFDSFRRDAAVSRRFARARMEALRRGLGICLSQA
ncbi:alpha/beta hydrolase [Novosphingobium sp. 9U]|uniref:alpha/beta hydrolase n=1 Tax=Novosphingobium sp. 9U TaxID=2653158 RepID=UPI0012F0341C|nr:alpha/beta hydrolase [Novosphingobium sp. 9U]VWX53314.1 Alpha/beta hydrolase [Novosphingobium sp. 9U]